MGEPLRLTWTRRAQEDLRRLPADIAERVVNAVDRLAATGQGDVRKLEGAEDEYRLRVGDHGVRFIYEEANAEARVMLILRVLHRREAYRGTSNRWASSSAS